MTKSLLIVEESLRDLKAHWFEYIKTITNAAHSQGYCVDVACHQDASSEVRESFNSFPIFRDARYLDSQRKKLPGERYYGFILHSLKILKILRPFLRQRDRYSQTFVPTVLIHHLIAWLVIMRFHPHRPEHLTLFFVANPGVWDPEQGRSCLPKSPMVMIQRSLLRCFKKMINEGSITFAVETMGAKNEFETLTDLPFQLFPHPVPPITQISLPYESNISSLKFACYGFARHEKGSDLLGTAIERIVKQNSEHPQFCVQWVDAFSLPDGSVCSSNGLKQLSEVQVIERSLETQEYQVVLQNTDCMLLPYRNSSYHSRLSRIAIESACLGIPMIYTKGGWLEDLVGEFGSGISIRDEDVEDLIRAIGEMASEYPAWRQRAIAKQNIAQQYFSGEMFCHKLFKQDQSQENQIIPHSTQALT